MRLLLVLCLLLCLTSCSVFNNGPTYTFETGRYWVIHDIEKPEQMKFCRDWIIQNNNGDILVVDPADGDYVMSGSVHDGRFFISRTGDAVSAVYKGRLTSNSRVEGTANQTVRQKDGPDGSGIVEELSGRFVIRPMTSITPRESFSFLPLVDYGPVSKKVDPRTVSVMIAEDGSVYDPEIVYADYSTARFIHGKRKLPGKQLKNKLKASVAKYGAGIPANVYADKRSPVRACSVLFSACRESGISRVKFHALQPRWDELFVFPLELPSGKDMPEAREQSESLTIKVMKGRILVKEELLTVPKFDAFLENVAHNYPDFRLTYSRDATVQDLLDVVCACRKYGSKEIYVSPKASVVTSSVNRE